MTCIGRTLYALACLVVVLSAARPGLCQTPSVLDGVRECDILAAHPGDTQRMAEGVGDDRIVPRLAIRACEIALTEDPKEARFAFQLGRALLAGGRKADAATQFEAAAQAGSAVAWAYLGDSYQFGYRGTVDFRKAYDAYGSAFDNGFERAKALLEMMVFTPEAFTADTLAEIYVGNLAEVLSRSNGTLKWPTRAYVFAFVQKLLGECEQGISPTTVGPLFRYRYDGWNAETDSSLAVEANAASAEYDGQTFLRRHGCESPVSKQLLANIQQLVKGF